MSVQILLISLSTNNAHTYVHLQCMNIRTFIHTKTHSTQMNKLVIMWLVGSMFGNPQIVGLFIC